MNWNSSAVRQSLQDLRENLALQGRDSRVVRAAFAYSRAKKRFCARLTQLTRGLFGARPKNPKQLRVFFWLPGGLGDAACARRLVSAYRALLPNTQMEIYSPFPDAVKTVFGDWPDITEATSSKIYWKNYDLVVFACLTVKFLHADETRLAALAPRFLPVFKKAVEAQDLLGGLLEDPFLTEPALGRWLLKNGGRRFDWMSFTGGVDLPHNATECLTVAGNNKFNLTGPYITFHDGSSRTDKNLPTRFWPQTHWRKFIQLFKKKFPGIKIVQLGGKNAPVYPEADVCLSGKTKLTDLPELLNGALCHIDTESGLVHLAEFLKVKSVVLFGPSDVRFFGYAKNKNLSAGNCGGCMWMRADWMTHCPLEKTEAPCVKEITPEQVLAAVEEVLSNH